MSQKSEPPRSRMLKQIGQFYDTERVLAWLRITRAELRKRQANHSILACSTADREEIFPTWQFQADGTLLPGLSDVLEVLSQGTNDEWTWALWLTGRVSDELDGKSAVQWLTGGGDYLSVVDYARRDASIWSR